MLSQQVQKGVYRRRFVIRSQRFLLKELLDDGNFSCSTWVGRIARVQPLRLECYVTEGVMHRFKSVCQTTTCSKFTLVTALCLLILSQLREGKCQVSDSD